MWSQVVHKLISQVNFTSDKIYVIQRGKLLTPISRYTLDIIYNKMLKNNIGLYDIMYSETGRQRLKLSIHFTRYQVSWFVINHVLNN